MAIGDLPQYCLDMDAIGTALRQLREEKGLTLRDFEAKLHAAGHNISFTALGAKERGEIRIKPPERRLYAELLGETLEQFDNRWRGVKNPRTRVTNDSQSGIPVINRTAVGMVVDYGVYGMDSSQAVSRLDAGDIADEHAFAVVVVGKDMEPTISENDYLICSPLDVPQPRVFLDVGKVVFVQVAKEAKAGGFFIGRYAGTKNGEATFTKDNAKFAKVVVKSDHIERIAVAIERRNKL